MALRPPRREAPNAAHGSTDLCVSVPHDLDARGRAHLAAKEGKLILGADECGLGSLAGPLVVCCAASSTLQPLVCKDSKKYGPHGYFTGMWRDIERSRWYDFAVVYVDPIDLCRWGYAGSLAWAYRTAVNIVRARLQVTSEEAPVTIDGSTCHGIRHAHSMPKADALVPVVSLASCLGKNAQLEAILSWHEQYPEYDLVNNKGYGTPTMLAALKRHGALPGLHRIPVIANMQLFQTNRLKTRTPRT